MEIKDMSIEQIEAHLEERKRVKPRATPGNIADLFVGTLKWNNNSSKEWVCDLLRESLDWTPPKQDYELELVHGLPMIFNYFGYWCVEIYDSNNPKAQSRPFDRSLVGKAVNNEKM